MTAWGSLIITLVVWGGYFLVVAGEMGRPAPAVDRIMGAFVQAVVLSIILSIVSAIAVAVIGRNSGDAAPDERERLISLKATNLAYAILCVGVLLVALATPIVATLGPKIFPQRPELSTVLIAANAALFAFVLAETIREAGQIIGFRRGR